MRGFLFGVIGAVVLVVAVAGAGSRTAWAGVDCGQYDPDCSQRIFRILSQPTLVPLQVTGGARFGSDGAHPVIEFKTSLASMDAPAGELEILPFEVLYLPDGGGMRLRVSLIDGDVLFFCTDAGTGVTHPPIVGAPSPATGGYPPLAGFFYNCKPDASFGIGASIADTQWDISTGRVSMRLLEAKAVYDFLRNGDGPDFLRKRLMAYAGFSVDHTGGGESNIPGAPTSGDWALRGNLGITGMLRTTNGKWEIDAMAGFRPNAIEWDDWAVEARIRLMYRILLSGEYLGTIGLEADYSHWTKPYESFGSFASDRSQDTEFVGLIFGFNF